jgi:hypothetical protein
MELDVDTRQRLWKIEEEKKKIANRIKRLVVGDGLKLLDFSNKDERGFIEYERGLFIRDITSELAARLGLTSLHIMVKYDIEICSHEHVLQSQTIMVKEGKIHDLDTTSTYYKYDSFFINKKHRHRLKYFGGSEYLITFMPQLDEEIIM